MLLKESQKKNFERSTCASLVLSSKLLINISFGSAKWMDLVKYCMKVLLKFVSFGKLLYN